MKSKFLNLKGILSVMLAFICIISCGLCLSACGSKEYDNHRNIKEIVLDKVHVEYGNIVYVKDGNDIYAKSGVYSMSGRREVYVRENLSDGVFYWQGEGQHYISARWDEYNDCWNRADSDSFYPDNGWVANDQNHYCIYGSVNNVQGPYTNAYMFHGYSDVNSPLNSTTSTKLENETLTLLSGQQVVCEVWETVFEYNGTYDKSKYWFALDSHIYLKGLWTSNKNIVIGNTTNEDVSSYGMPEATYYAVGESMDSFLQTLSPLRSKPDFSPWH